MVEMVDLDKQLADKDVKINQVEATLKTKQAKAKDMQRRLNLALTDL